MTRPLKSVYLKPLSGYKTPLRSDTLWGLLCWGIRHLYGEQRLETFLHSYTEGGNPEWIISSTFPYKDNGNGKVHFFPKPFLPHVEQKPTESGKESNISEKEQMSSRKKENKIAWVEQSDFEEILKTGKMPKASTDVSKKPPKERPTISMHNRIDRLTLSTFKTEEESGQLFQTANIFWENETEDKAEKKSKSDDKETIGLFFLADVRDEAAAALLLSVLRLYRHLGMGGNRSIGSGFFETTMTGFELTESKEPNAVINLSLFKPEIKEIENLDALDNNSHFLSYQLEQREGRSGFDTYFNKKDPITFFKEGSILPISALNLTGRFSGQLIENKKIDKNYTYGYGFMVKMKI